MASRADQAPQRHRALLPAVVAYACLLFAWSALRHAHYGSHAFDLGAYHQIFFNLGAHGSLYSPIEHMHQWSAHIELALLPVGLVYRAVPTPLWLFAAQAASCAAVALPLDALARRLTGDAGIALVCVLATLLTPQLLFASILDFHSITLCALPIAVLALGIETERIVLVVVGAGLALALREQMGLALAGAAIGWVVRHGRGRWRQALCLGGAGLLVFFAELLWLLPHFGHGKPFRYLATNYAFGTSAPQVVRTILAHPLDFATFPFRGRRRLVYPLAVASGAVLPMLFAFVRAPRRALLPVLTLLPLLLVQLYSVRVPIFSIEFHYGAPLVPLFGIAAIVGVGAVAAKSAKAARGVALVWLVATAIHAALAVAPLAREEGGPLDPTFAGSPRAEALAIAVSMIPADSDVSAQDTITPHIEGNVRLWPDAEDVAQLVVLDANVPAGERTAEEVGQAVVRLRNDARFRVRFDRAGVLLVERAR